MMATILRSAGHEIQSASNIEESIKMLGTTDPDLLLLDLRLSDGEGWLLLDHLRARGRLESLPVVILSAHTDPSTGERAMLEGARGYVTKPFIASKLLDTVKEYARSDRLG
jgi:CheY-like chemotaxis protein